MGPKGRWELSFSKREDSWGRKVRALFIGMKGDAGEVTEFRKIIQHGAQEYCPVTGRKVEA